MVEVDRPGQIYVQNRAVLFRVLRQVQYTFRCRSFAEVKPRLRVVAGKGHADARCQFRSF